MNELMKVTTDLGVHLVPLAFLLYLPIRWITYYFGGFPHNKLLNGLWYAGVVMCYVLDVTGTGSTVTLLMFISMLDGFFIYLEKQRSWNDEFEPTPEPSGEDAAMDEQEGSSTGSSTRANGRQGRGKDQNWSGSD